MKFSLPRQSSKHSVLVNNPLAGPEKRTLQMCRLISACAGNSSKPSFQQFVRMYMRHKAKAIDWADLPWGRKHSVLPGCCHLILFRGLSDQQADSGKVMIQNVEIRKSILLKPQLFRGESYDTLKMRARGSEINCNLQCFQLGERHWFNPSIANSRCLPWRMPTHKVVFGSNPSPTVLLRRLWGSEAF